MADLKELINKHKGKKKPFKRKRENRPWNIGKETLVEKSDSSLTKPLKEINHSSPTRPRQELKNSPDQNLENGAVLVDQIDNPELASEASVRSPKLLDTDTSKINKKSELHNTNRTNCITNAEQIQNNNITNNGTIAEQLRNNYTSNNITNTEQLHNRSNKPELSSSIDPKKNIADENNGFNSKSKTKHQLHNNNITNNGTNTEQLHNDSITNNRTNTDQLHNNNVAITAPIAEQITEPIAYPITEQKDREKLYFSYSCLMGVKSAIYEFIISECIFNGENFTTGVTLEKLSEVSQKPKGTVQTTISRLKKDKLLFSLQSKKGKGGWTVYSIPKELFKMISTKRSSHNYITNNVPNNRTNNVPNNRTNNSSSSSNLNNNTITSDEKYKQYEHEYKGFHIPESMSSLGYTKSHLFQLYSDDKFSKEEITRALEHYSFDIQNSFARPKSVVGFLHKIMRGEGAVLYVSEALTKKMMSDKAQHRKRAQALSEALKKDADVELDIVVDKIFNKLTREEKEKVYPPTSIVTFGSSMHAMQVRLKIKNKILETGSWSLD